MTHVDRILEQEWFLDESFPFFSSAHELRECNVVDIVVSMFETCHLRHDNMIVTSLFVIISRAENAITEEMQHLNL